MALLGLIPDQLQHLCSSAVHILPSIASWFKESPGDDTDSDNDDSESDGESISEAQALQDLLDREEDKTLSRTRRQEENLLNLTCAAMAVIADDATKMYVLSSLY